MTNEKDTDEPDEPDAGDDDRAAAGGFGTGLAAGGAGAAGGIAATAAVEGLLDGTAGAAAASAPVAGPIGVPLSAPGPVGTPTAAGPTGTAAGSGPGGTPLTTATKVAPKRPLGLILAGGVAAVAVAVGAVVVTSGDDEAAVTSTTIDDGDPGETTTTLGETTTSTEAVTTTLAASGARGLSGVVELVAGNGSDDGAGRPGPAVDASLGSNPRVAVAPNGDLFVISGAPVVMLVRGGSIEEIYTGAADEFAFGGVAVGPDGSAYVSMSTGVKRVGADGSSELVLDAAAQGLGTSFGAIAVDHAGDIFVVDRTTLRVLRATPGGTATPFAGTGTQAAPGQPPTGDGGPATASPLAAVEQLAIDAQGTLLVADSGHGVVRAVGTDGVISTITGSGATVASDSVGEYAPDGTPAGDLDLDVVGGVAVDSSGRVYVSDTVNRVVFRFEPGGGIELVIADQQGGGDSPGRPANETRVLAVRGLAIDAEGALVYVESNAVRRILGAASS